MKQMLQEATAAISDKKNLQTDGRTHSQGICRGYLNPKKYYINSNSMKSLITKLNIKDS